VITGVAISTTTVKKSRIAAAGLLYRTTDCMIARPVIRCLDELETLIAKRWQLPPDAVDRHAGPDDAVPTVARLRAI
jgi:hypothetical protein